MENIRKRLRKLRHAHGFSVEQVSDFFNVDYYKIESGSEDIYMDTVEELACLYNCSEEYILCENDDYDYDKIPRGIESFDLNVLAQVNMTMGYIKLLKSLDD